MRRRLRAELLSYIERCPVRCNRFGGRHMRSKANRTVAAVIAAALALPTAGMAPAFAASKGAKNATVSAASDTEFSSRRYYRGHRYRNNAAGAAAFAAIIGGIATYAAAREYRKSRER